MRLSNRLIILIITIVSLGTNEIMAIEEAPYEIVKSEGPFELRDYAPHILAETLVSGSLEEAGNRAFRPLFDYISGNNHEKTKIAMTAPVSQQPGRKIPMTAPVSQQRSENQWLVSFMMPASFSMETLPIPNDPQVTLRQVPARRMAVVRYSGFWSEKNYRENLQKLEDWVQKNGLTVTCQAIWARYNAPYVPWFMRRNEVLLPIAVTD